jgi:hypothetical protein
MGLSLCCIKTFVLPDQNYPILPRHPKNTYLLSKPLLLTEPWSLLSISRHPLLNPSPTLLSMLLHLRRILTQLLHPMRIGNMSPLLHPGSLQHPLIPRLQRRELININA